MARKILYNFRLEPALIERVDRVAGPGQRTQFVTEAIDAKLAESESFGLYTCPAEGCNFHAGSPAANCPTHGRRVVAT